MSAWESIKERYMAVATFIVIQTSDSTVYITFLGLHVAVMPLYKWLQKREDRLDGHDSEVRK